MNASDGVVLKVSSQRYQNWIVRLRRKNLFCQIDAIRIHYKVIGGSPGDSGDVGNNSIVLLHGWGSNIENYGQLQTYLGKFFKVYAIDLPGFGLSSEPSSPWDTKDYAELIAKLIQTLKINRPILIGHSFGGKIALYLIAKKLISGKKLVLINSAGIKSQKTLCKWLKIYSYKFFKHIAQLPLVKMVLQPRLEMYRKKFGSQDYRDASGVMRNSLVKIVNEDFRVLLPLIDVPTLLIWGDQDTKTPLSDGQLMQQLIPNVQLVVLVGTGHFSYVDNFAEFILPVHEFLFKN